MKKYIKCDIQNLNDDEILKMIPPDTLARIKAVDKKPEFRVYCIGHEGTANANELSFGAKLKKAFNYVKDMVIKLGEKLQIGTAIFNRHADTNAHIGREQIGELVGKGFRFIKDRLSTLAAIYIYPQYRKLPLDVASIEANIEYIPKSKGSADVIDIENITGIALSSSAIDKPAFPGASLLGIVQAFTEKGGEKMTLEEIKEAIREAGLKITDLFTPEEIISTEPARKAKQTEFEHAKRVERSLGEERERVITLTKALEEANAKVKTLNEAVNSMQVKSLFEKANEVRKFDDKQKAFIEKHLKSFKSDKAGEDLKLEFDKFLDAQLNDYKEIASLLGVDANKAADKAEETRSTAPIGDGSGNKDFSNPETNEFIPKE